ncbi:MAG: site-specific DNA-methyltransferase, partial [Flavobacteriales bacterium]|nr:site-specific DNA-methyltransferase [Flavobacteriales bacterium]
MEYMRGMEDNSVDAIVTDPPYFRVKGEAWDNQWDSSEKFIEWIGQLSEQWQRILKPNGSLYCFASPRMAARVEVKIGERFNVLASITWA